MPTFLVIGSTGATRLTSPPRDKVGEGSMLGRDPSQTKMGVFPGSGRTVHAWVVVLAPLEVFMNRYLYRYL